MASFCASRNMSTTVYDEPTLRDLYHHLLVDDERKILFCYVPKVTACKTTELMQIDIFTLLTKLVLPDLKLGVEQLSYLGHYSFTFYLRAFKLLLWPNFSDQCKGYFTDNSLLHEKNSGSFLPAIHAIVASNVATSLVADFLI